MRTSRVCCFSLPVIWNSSALPKISRCCLRCLPMHCQCPDAGIVSIPLPSGMLEAPPTVRVADYGTDTMVPRLQPSPQQHQTHGRRLNACRGRRGCCHACRCSARRPPCRTMHACTRASAGAVLTMQSKDHSPASPRRPVIDACRHLVYPVALLSLLCPGSARVSMPDACILARTPQSVPCSALPWPGPCWSVL